MTSLANASSSSIWSPALDKATWVTSSTVRIAATAFVAVSNGAQRVFVVVVGSELRFVGMEIVVVEDKKHGTNIVQRSALFVCPVPHAHALQHFPTVQPAFQSEPKPGPKLGSICLQCFSASQTIRFHSNAFQLGLIY